VTVVECLIWGLFGGFAVEGLDFIAQSRRPPAGWPWKRPGHPGLGPYAISIIIRLLVGGGLAVATTLSEYPVGPLGALGIGVAAPLIVEKLAGQALDYFPAPPPAEEVVPSVAAGASNEA
jgi:hypothetical protein